MRETGVLYKRPFAKTKKKGWVKEYRADRGLRCGAGTDGDVNHIVNPGWDGWYIFGKVTGEFTTALAKDGGIADAHIDNRLGPSVE